MPSTAIVCKKSAPTLNRQHFETSRSLDFLSKKELIAQTGHQVAEWPFVCLKELMDNALDACEESGVAPVVSITVDEHGITVADNGPGIPAKVIESVLNFSIRVSSREAYVSPDRGKQGNALKTVVAMPFALGGHGRVIVEALGIRHEITVGVDRIRQEPKIDHLQSKSDIQSGTKITVEWQDLACLNSAGEKLRFLQKGEKGADSLVDQVISLFFKQGEKGADSARLILDRSKSRFLQIAEDYCWLNPHLSLSITWGDEHSSILAWDLTWKKWIPSNPTDPAWYGVDELERLIAANICRKDRLVREFVCEFRGLSGTAKQKKVLDAVGMSRTMLSELVVDNEIDKTKVGKLLAAMQAETTPVKPQALGIIGKDHLQARCSLAGGDPDSFNYKKILGETKGLPWVIETCFAYCPEEDRPRRIIPGVNWSPGIINPFRQLGQRGESLDSILEQQRAGRDEPTILVIHMACPKVSYSDRGKSSVIVEE